MYVPIGVEAGLVRQVHDQLIEAALLEPLCEAEEGPRRQGVHTVLLAEVDTLHLVVVGVCDCRKVVSSLVDFFPVGLSDPQIMHPQRVNHLLVLIVVEEAEAGVSAIDGRERWVQDHIVKHEILYWLILPFLVQLDVRV